jgi:hypothetical protein
MSASKSTLCLVLHVLGVEHMLCGDFLHKYKQGFVVFILFFYKMIGLLITKSPIRCSERKHNLVVQYFHPGQKNSGSQHFRKQTV